MELICKRLGNVFLPARRVAAGLTAALACAVANGQAPQSSPSAKTVEKQSPEQQARMQSGDVLDSGIGAEVQDVKASIASSFGMGRATGAIVASVTQGSPAYQAGVQVGDVFLSLGKVAVRDAHHLSQLLDSHAPGSIVTARVWRKPYTIPLTINLPTVKGSAGREERTMPVSTRVTGLVVRELSHADRCDAGVESGLLVESAQGPAAAAGIRPGAIILRMNAAPLTRIEELYAMLGERAGKEVALLVNQGGQSRFLSLAVPRKVK